MWKCICGDEQESKQPAKVHFEMDPYDTKEPVLHDMDETLRTCATSVSESTRTRDHSGEIALIKGAGLRLKKDMIRDFVKENMAKRTKRYFIVEYDWTMRFSNFVRSERTEMLAPICNRKLLDRAGNLNPKLQRNKDFVLLNEIVYSLIKELFEVDVEIEEQRSETEAKPCGLANNKYLCYLNAGMQLLFTISELANYFANYQPDAVRPFCDQSCRVFRKLKKLNENCLQGFSKLVKQEFAQSKQHDCQQFLKFYFGKLQDELNPVRPNPKKAAESEKQSFEEYCAVNKSIIDRLFTIYTENKVTCSACKTPKRVYEAGLQLVVSLTRDADLESMIRQEFKEETLEDKLRCDYCGAYESGATLKSTLTRLPRYLLVYIMRYKNSGTKTHYSVKFGQQLNLGAILRTETKFVYDLQAIVEHAGLGSGSGHYLAFVRKGAWFECDDQRVKRLSSGDVLCVQPYILLYKLI